MCQLLATKVRDVVDVFEIRECSKSVDKSIRKISKNNFVLWGTQTTIEILRVQNVPFEGTDLPLNCALLNARKHSLESRVKHFENGRIFRETDTSLKFALIKRTTPRNYPVLRRYFFEILSLRQLNFDREECTITTISFVLIVMTASRVVCIDEITRSHYLSRSCNYFGKNAKTKPFHFDSQLIVRYDEFWHRIN